MSESEPPIINSFDGAIIVRHAHQTHRAFSFDITFDLTHPHLIKLAAAEKPPLHFHPYQEEYMQVTSGELGVEVEGKEYVLTPADGEFLVRPWTNHRLYPLAPAARSGGGGDGRKQFETTRFFLSGEETSDAFRLDTVFFQNWYGYQDEVLIKGQDFDLLQVMNMFDAGGSYLTFPTWIPFSKRLAQITGIVLGRWIGGLLGYQPFFRKWTSDWQTACEKMESTVFLRRFADRAKLE